MDRLVLRVIKRADLSMKRGDIRRAIGIYEGSFQHYSTVQEVHNRVAELYIEVGDMVRAGRHLYFKEDPSDIEKECITMFEKRCDNSPVLILKNIISKENFKIIPLDNKVKRRLRYLVNGAVDEAGTVPNFLKGIKRHLDKTL
ncbi:MAG: hypothetical protein N4A72_11050 [Bacteroidales bacterium]|jgi:hypothetical protein|nr:hypothetical protein [Bacteroidales bacterium]